jgi:hypothetical protein
MDESRDTNGFKTNTKKNVPSQTPMCNVRKHKNAKSNLHVHVRFQKKSIRPCELDEQKVCSFFEHKNILLLFFLYDVEYYLKNLRCKIYININIDTDSFRSPREEFNGFLLFPIDYLVCACI